MQALQGLKVAGDWLIYSELLLHGRIAFTAQALNFHRRHDESVTISARNNEQHMREILQMQSWIASKATLDDSVRSKARAFAEHAVRHLNLDEHEFLATSATPIKESN